ncbi:MAG: bifunctional phosphopantothenoylcysteine decarboxylase/phosphopantothenate--cysteine ligase CoaBC [Methylomonas sp.]
MPVASTVINKKILLGVCGGVAAYKSAELTRLLIKQGCQVRVAMTACAQQFVGPLTFQALSGHPVYTALTEAGQEQAMNHIHLARWADRLLIAPATANIIAKLAHGLADDLLTTLYLVAECPVLIAPSMNQAMWRKPVVRENIARLQRQGAQIIGPEAGEQACGDVGWGRMSEPEAICERLLGVKQPGALENLKVVITAGPTREPLDPVRFISNRSSGKMGYALANAALCSGAHVTLISGPVQLSAPPSPRLRVIAVETAEQMLAAVMPHAVDADIFIGAAAVADYRPERAAAHKLKKSAEILNIALQKNADIIAAVAKLAPKPFTVGFAAETDDLENYAREKMAAKNLDMIAANLVGGGEGGFDSDKNALRVFWPGGEQNLALTDKPQLAGQLIDLIAERRKLKDAESGECR